MTSTKGTAEHVLYNKHRYRYLNNDAWQCEICGKVTTSSEIVNEGGDAEIDREHPSLF